MARIPAAERRAQLIEAAIAVMSRDGVAHTTTRAVVAEAGMPVGVFHYCFRSKEELMQEAMQVITARTFDAVAPLLTEPAPPAQLIATVVDAYWAHLTAHPLDVQLTYELTQHALREPALRAAAQEQYGYYAEAMEHFLLDTARAGGFRWRTQVDLLARLLLAMVRGITIQWLVTRDDQMGRVLMDEVVTLLYRDAGLAAAE